MVITDLRMESNEAGLDVIRAAKHAKYQPAVALLTAYPMAGSDWDEVGADEMLVKPMNTQDLLLQIEALLVAHEDKKAAHPVPAVLKPAGAAAARKSARKSAGA
jgi:DNA-binding response OmpR family regulator